MGDARVIEDADQVALGHLLDVGAGGERLAAAGEHHGAGGVVLFGGGEFGGQLAEQLAGQGVQRFRALQGDQAHARFGGNNGKGARHRTLLRLHARLGWPAHYWMLRRAPERRLSGRVFRV
ncbi:hypothetical protein FQZ97_748370 [compost metagenome]